MVMSGTIEQPSAPLLLPLLPGLKRADYIEAFFNNIDWNEAGKRVQEAARSQLEVLLEAPCRDHMVLKRKTSPTTASDCLLLQLEASDRVNLTSCPDFPPEVLL
jgi:hypothetical protein